MSQYSVPKISGHGRQIEKKQTKGPTVPGRTGRILLMEEIPNNHLGCMKHCK